uniref:Uncharacterized protein n=1 Tax=Romanomermis culicivorax TaxID=13658 RepID=A0A915LAX3_ROMCU
MLIFGRIGMGACRRYMTAKKDQDTNLEALVVEKPRPGPGEIWSPVEHLMGTLLLASYNGKSICKSTNWTTSGADICIKVKRHKEEGSDNSILIVWRRAKGPGARLADARHRKTLTGILPLMLETSFNGIVDEADDRVSL